MPTSSERKPGNWGFRVSAGVQGVPTGTGSPPEPLEAPEEPPELVDPPAPPLVAFTMLPEHACAVRTTPPITKTWNILFMSEGLP
jgi:hypothetical protein